MRFLGLLGPKPEAPHQPKHDFGSNFTLERAPRETVYTSTNWRGSRGEVYRSETFSLNTIDDMLDDPIVGFGFGFLTLPLVQVAARVLGNDKEQRDFIADSLVTSGVLSEICNEARFAISHGFCGWETRWHIESAGRVVPRSPNLLRWTDVEILEEDQSGPGLGEFKGLKYYNRGGRGGVRSTVYLYTVDEKCMLLTWQKSRRDRYGYPQLKPAFPAWKQRRLNLYKDLAYYIERHANPAVVVRAPSNQKIQVGDTEYLSMVYAQIVAKNWRRGISAAFPSDTDDKGNPLWSIEIPTTEDRTPIYEAANRMLKAEILNALLIPERALMEGMYGTKAEAETHGEELSTVRDAFGTHVEKMINESIVRPLLRWNFSNPDPTIKITLGSTMRYSREMQLAVINKVIEKWAAGEKLPPDLADQVAELTGLRIPTDDIDAMIEAVKPKEIDQVAIDQTDNDINKEPGQEHLHDHWEHPKVLLSRIDKGEFKLGRKPTEVELSFRSEKQWVELLRQQVYNEVDLIGEIEGIVRDQRQGAEAFVRTTWQEQKPKRLTKIPAFMLRKSAAEESYIRKWITAQTYSAAEEAFDEIGAAKDFPERLSPDAFAWCKARASSITMRIINRLEQDIRDSLIQLATRNAGVNEVVRSVNDYFAAMLDDTNYYSVPRILTGLASECISTGRQMLLDKTDTKGWRYNGRNLLEGTNAIVIVERSELMDADTCKVCERLDGLKLKADDEDLEQWIAPAKCLGNRRSRGRPECRGFNLYLTGNTRPENLEGVIDPRKNPPLPPGMETGDF